MLVEGRWVPTFPKARYLMGHVEFAHWTSQHEREDMSAVLADSVTPVSEAGLVDLVETDHRICDEVSLVPTLGHTPGHVSVRIASQGEEALITGDSCITLARSRIPSGRRRRIATRSRRG